MDNREAIKILSDICKAYRNFTTEEICALELAIKALVQTRWIPVSERLPKTNGRFLTYIVNPYDSEFSYMMVCDYIRQTWCPDDETASSNVVA